MNFVKKMCILRQVKQGFSGDGKILSGLVKIEQYGKNLSVEISVINFAPLSTGEYYCLIADRRRRAEMLPLRGKSLFNLVSDLEIADGFCAVICLVKNGVAPIAYGVNGKDDYDWQALVKNAVLFEDDEREQESENVSEKAELAPPPAAPPAYAVADESAEPTDEKKKSRYDDETVATSNYYEVDEDGRFQNPQAANDEPNQSADTPQAEGAGADAAKNDDAQGVRDGFAKESDGYYLSIKRELDELFKSYPADDTLLAAFPYSEWVRVKNEDGNEYLVGVLYEDLKAKYVTYALRGKKDSPPEELKGACAFVPTSKFDDGEGYFVIFQSCATGECIRPESL